MRAAAFSTACLLILATSYANKSGFILSAPKILQSGATEQVCLKWHHIPVDVEATISILNKEETLASYPFTFPNGKSKCVDLKLPSISQEKVTLLIKGKTADNDYKFRGNKTVSIRQDSFLTFIQTDKPIYKPGQTVKFRILSVKPDLKPLLGDKVSKVWIQDPVGTRIMQWLEITNQGGLSSMEMKLSEEPVQGEWKISAIVDGKTQEQTFEVKEYVLPKFSVTITPPTHLPVDADLIEFEVCARYTYGEPVSGDLVISLCVPQDDRYTWRTENAKRPCSLILESIKGCKKIKAPTSYIELTNPDYYLSYSAKLEISATVTEEGTGTRLNATDDSCEFVHERLNIDISSNSPSGFKPGLNFYGKAVVTYPGGEPAPNEKIEISANNYKSGEVYKKLYESDENGEIQFSVPSFKRILDSSYSIFAKAIAYKYNYTSDFKYHLRMYTPSSSHYVKQWFSPSGSFLQIEPIQQSLTCGDEVEIEVAYTTEANTKFLFNYEVMSRGNIVKSGHRHQKFKHEYVQPTVPAADDEDEEEYGVPVVEETIVSETASVLGNNDDKELGTPLVEEEIVRETASVLGRTKRDIIPYFRVEETSVNITLPTHVGSTTISFRITPKMSPLARLIVYYTRPDGEIVADTMELQVDNCLANEVEMEFSEDTVRPGESTTLNLKASPESLCAVGVVDKSVHILKSSNQLTMARIFKQLEDYDIDENSGYREFNDYCEKQLAKLPKPTYSPPDGPRRPAPVPFDGEVREIVPEEVEVEVEIMNGEGSDSDEEEVRGGDGDAPMRRKRSIWFGDQSNYYDALRAFEEEGLIVITDMTLQTRPCRRYTIMPYATRVDGVALPMAVDDVESTTVQRKLGSAGPSKKSSVNLRSYFPETWLWDLEVIGEDGNLALDKKVPDTITEWVGSAFCTHPETGLGVSPITTLRAFKPFFASFNLPYSVVRGEKVPVPVSVFNYMDECMAINLKLKRSVDGGYERLDKLNSVDVCLCGQESLTHKFRILPKKLGEVNITISATVVNKPEVCDGKPITVMTWATDAVIRPLLVEAEGLPQEYTYSAFFCPQKEGTNGSVFEEIDLPLPSDTVEGSARGSVTLIGDIMGPALSNLDNLLRMPYGCGEQNMVGFAPNIFVMQYLTHTSQVNAEIEGKVKEYMRSGYQRELTYKHPDGSYSAFGERDDSGSMWLTAFVVKCFAQAKPFVYIDDEVLDQAVSWFKGHQLENGCFPSVGRVLGKYMKGGIDGGKDAALTAYVLVAMLEADAPKHDESVVDAVRCLDAQTVEDSYTLALMAYAYNLYDPASPKALEYMDLLKDNAVEKDGLMHWHNPSVKKTASNDWFRPYGQRNAASVEMTSYALLAIINGGDDALVKGLPIVRWLSQQRNSYGGFASTQDTVIALQALAKYASLAFGGGVELDVLVNSPTGVSELTVTNDNSLVLQTVPVDSLPAVVNYRAVGTGCGLLQANVKYNIEDLSKPTPAFKLGVKTLAIPSPPRQKCQEKYLINVCASYYGDDDASNMAVIEVKMVSGWIPVKNSLKRLMEDQSLNLKRYDVEPKFVNFYFDELDNSQTCIGFEVEQNIKVEQAKPATVRVYDYYEQDQFAVDKYELKKICGTKLEIPFLTGPDLEKAKERGEQVRIPSVFPGSLRRNGDVSPSDDDDEEKNMEISVDTSVPEVPQTLPQEQPKSDDDSSSSEETLVPFVAILNSTYSEAASCPICVDSLPFEELMSEVCNSKHVYKLRKRKEPAYPLKVMADLRPRIKELVGKFANYFYLEACSCDMLTKAAHGSKFLALTQNEKFFNKVGSDSTVSIGLDSNTYVLPLNREVERRLRRMIKSDGCSPA